MTCAAGLARLHADATGVLRAWTAPDDDQEALRRRYLGHLAAHPDAMAKAGPPTHLTGSVLVLDAARERVLLTLHAKARRWFQLGGHFEEGDATMADAALREGREESGITGLRLVSPHPVQLDAHMLAGPFGRCREHLDVRYAALAPTGAAHVLSDESLDLRWWPVGALPPGSRDELASLVAAAQRA